MMTPAERVRFRIKYRIAYNLLDQVGANDFALCSMALAACADSFAELVRQARQRDVTNAEYAMLLVRLGDIRECMENLAVLRHPAVNVHALGQA